MAEGPIFPTRSGRLSLGVLGRKTIPQPAVGVDARFTVPGGVWARVLALRATLTTSAAVGNRWPGVIVTDGTATLLRPAAGVAISANTGVPISAFAGASIFGAGGQNNNADFTLNLPDLLLPAGFVVGFFTAQLDAADQWSALEVLYEEHDIGPIGLPTRVHFPHNIALMEVD